MMLEGVKVKIKVTFTPAGSNSYADAASLKSEALASLQMHEKRLKSCMCYKKKVFLFRLSYSLILVVCDSD